MLIRKRSSGFTIVELLIVVVVIAILAAITIVAYNGITDRSNQAVVQNAATEIRKKVLTYAVDNSDNFPISLTNAGISGSDDQVGITYRYSYDNVANPKTFCITAIKGTNRAYVPSSTGITVKGSCLGHDNDSNYITNLIANSSFENGLDISTDGSDADTGWSVSGAGVTMDRTTDMANSGAYSLKITKTVTGSGANIAYGPFKIENGLEYSMRYMARGLTAASGGLGGVVIVSSNTSAQGTITTTGWTTSYGWATSTHSGYQGYLSFQLPSAINTYYLDDIVVAQVSSTDMRGGVIPYRDGNSPSWIWNGPVGTATSTGPRS